MMINADEARGTSPSVTMIESTRPTPRTITQRDTAEIHYKALTSGNAARTRNESRKRGPGKGNGWPRSLSRALAGGPAGAERAGAGRWAARRPWAGARRGGPERPVGGATRRPGAAGQVRGLVAGTPGRDGAAEPRSSEYSECFVILPGLVTPGDVTLGSGRAQEGPSRGVTGEGRAAAATRHSECSEGFGEAGHRG